MDGERKLNDAEPYRRVDSCLLIESSREESTKRFLAAVMDLLREVRIGSSSADWPGISAGARFVWRKTSFREFGCIAGSVICRLYVRAGQDGGFPRMIILRGDHKCSAIHAGIETKFDSSELQPAE